MSVLIVTPPKDYGGVHKVYLGEPRQSRHVIAERVTAALLGKQQRVRLRHFKNVRFVKRVARWTYVSRANEAMKTSMSLSPYATYFGKREALARKYFDAALRRLQKKLGAEKVVRVGRKYK